MPAPSLGHSERTNDTVGQRRVEFLDTVLEGCRGARETLGTIPAHEAAALLADIEALERRVEAELAELRRRLTE